MLNKAIILGLIYLAGALSGWVYEHDKLVSLEAEIKGQAEIQQQIIAKNEEWNKQVIKESTNEYQKRLAAINTKYGRLHNYCSSSLSDPNSKENTSGAISTSSDDVPSERNLIKDCAVTTNMLVTLQTILKTTKELE